MIGLDTLINTINKEKNTASECKQLEVSNKVSKDYQAYLTGKEEAFGLVLRLLDEFKKLNDNKD
jgi:predicted transcriptional regulator